MLRCLTSSVFALVVLVFCVQPACLGQSLLPLPLPAAVESDGPAMSPPPQRFDLPPQALPTVPLTRPNSTATTSSTSSSRQFIVHGPELRIRSGLAARCDEISAELGRLLRTQDPWVHPIVVQIQTVGPADPPNLGITSQTRQLENEGFHLQLTVPERHGLKPADLKQELVRLLLVERILRSHKNVSSNREPLLPYWVHTGVMDALDYRHRTRPSAVFAAIFKSGQVYGIEQILDSQPSNLDGLSRTIYETSCCALVLALLDQPEGPRLFGRFLASLATDTKPEREMLSQWFPGLAESDSSLNKWWSLQLASLASPSIAETLPPTETAQLLDRALTIFVSGNASELPDPQSVISIASQRPDAPPVVAPEALPVINLPRVASTADAPPTVAKPASKPKPPAPKVTTATVVAEETETESETKTPGLLRRMLGFGFGGKDEDEELGEPKDESPVKKVAAPAPTKVEPVSTSEPANEEEMTREQRRETRRQEEARKDEERRLQKIDEEEAKAAEKASRAAMEAEKATAKMAEKEAAKAKPEPSVTEEKATAKKPEPAAKPAPTTKPTPAEKPTEAPNKGGGLNPLKWFRGKKSEDNPPAEKGASAQPERQLGRLLTDSQPLIRRDLLGLGQGRFIQASSVSPSPVTSDEPALPAPVESLSPDSFTAPPLPPLLGLGEPGLPAVSGDSSIQGGATQPLVVAPELGIAYPIEDYAVILAQPDRDRLLKQAALSLQDLAFRGNVLFREIARDYGAVIKDMQEGKTKDLNIKLANLRKRSIETYQAACAVQDHLDWYEASQSKEYSGLFEDFLTLPERITEELPPRLDPISTYVDQVERQLNR